MVGREYNHLEDLVFIEGNQGIRKINEFFSTVTFSEIHLKYDGFATCYWRWKNNQFEMATANSKRTGTWFKNPGDLEKFILKTGNNQSWRLEHAREMSEIFRILESSLTLDSGEHHADVLYSPCRMPEPNSGVFSFTPNLVTYQTNEITGDLGLAIHTGKPDHDDTVVNYSRSFMTDFQTKMTVKGSPEIDEFLNPGYGLKDFRNLIYKYMNWSHKNDMDPAVSEIGFLDWAMDNTSVTKHCRLFDHLSQYQNMLNRLLSMSRSVKFEKNRLIHSLDQLKRPLEEYTNGVPGGEGYVSQFHKVKLVPRHRWKPRDATTTRRTES